MTLAGVMAILAGWLLIMPLRPEGPVPAPVPQRRRLIRYVLAFFGTWLVTAGMATVVQARF